MAVLKMKTFSFPWCILNPPYLHNSLKNTFKFVLQRNIESFEFKSTEVDYWFVSYANRLFYYHIYSTANI